MYLWRSLELWCLDSDLTPQDRGRAGPWVGCVGPAGGAGGSVGPRAGPRDPTRHTRGAWRGDNVAFFLRGRPPARLREGVEDVECRAL